MISPIIDIKNLWVSIVADRIAINSLECKLDFTVLLNVKFPFLRGGMELRVTSRLGMGLKMVCGNHPARIAGNTH